MAEPKGPEKPISPAALAKVASTLTTTADPATLSGLHVVVQIPAQPGAHGRPERRAFHAADVDTVCKYWSTAPEKGLSTTEATRRLSRLGPNKLPTAEGPSLFARLIAQVSDFTVLALLAAAAIAAALSIFAPIPGASFLARFGDSIAILLIVVLNAILGLVQEKRAESALRALRDMTAPTARVKRDGQLADIPSTDVVPGDIVHLEEGDRVAADMRLISTADLEVEEAALTGESVPVAKDARLKLEPATPLADRVNMAFMGTRVARGRARGVVCNTGLHTELGSIAGLLAEVEETDTPLQEQLDRFGRDIVIGCVVVSAIVFVAGWWFGGYAPREMFLVAVALAVAAIPEGLPAITTITLALGTSRMAKRKALVRKLPAVETLGCTQVICTDKTGTLTQNAMTARRLWVAGTTYHVGGEAREIEGEISAADTQTTAKNSDLDLAVHAAGHAAGARLAADDGLPGRVQVAGDPTDAALLILARKGKKVEHEALIHAEVPFTSSRRMATLIAKEGDQLVAFIRGAPEVLLENSATIRDGGAARELTPDDKKQISEVAAAWGQDAMRVVALAVRDVKPEGDAEADPTRWERGLTFVALVGIVDPPRSEVAAAIAEAASAGIRTVMITGDHPATARAVAQEIGLWAQRDLVLTGHEIDQIDQQRLESTIQRVRIVARATAAHKLRIVEALKARGLVCAMTGDGVNDAPAVKAAHIGIAMGRAGTEVTKEAADLVLADDNYATIVAAVEEGRSIYENIRKFIYFLLSSNAGIVFVVLVASLLGWQAPLTPIQILWINLITNGLPALALGIDPKDPDQMKLPPRPTNIRLMSRNEWLGLTGVGAVMAIAALWVFWWAGGSEGDASGLARARALCFAVLSLAPMFHALNCRSETRSIFELGLFSNKAIWGASAIGAALVAMALYVPVLNPVFKTEPLGPSDVGVVLLLSVVMLAGGEVLKIFLRRRTPASTTSPA